MRQWRSSKAHPPRLRLRKCVHSAECTQQPSSHALPFTCPFAQWTYWGQKLWLISQDRQQKGSKGNWGTMCLVSLLMQCCPVSLGFKVIQQETWAVCCDTISDKSLSLDLWSDIKLFLPIDLLFIVICLLNKLDFWLFNNYNMIMNNISRLVEVKDLYHHLLLSSQSKITPHLQELQRGKAEKE